MLPHAAHGVQDCIVEAGELARFAQTLLIGPYIDKIQRIGGAQAGIDEFVTRLEQQIDAPSRAELEVVLALGANLQVGLEFGLEKKLATARAFDPQALGAHVLHAPIGTIPASRSVFRSGKIAVLALEPR